MVGLPADVVRRYGRFSLYNSPYPAHDAGHAIDLYPDGNDAISPVSGTVLATRTVRCPERSYAASEDSLLLIDCGEYVARILHVDPAVEPDDRITVGDSLGSLVRSGFFGRWVDNHIHLEFRRPEQNLQRASGSVRLELDLPVTGIRWGGTGTVIKAGGTHVVVDSPVHDGAGFAALASDEGVPLDGGMPHYAGGGVFGPTEGELSLLGTTIGTVENRTVSWEDIAVFANGTRATGLSIFAAQDRLGAKLVFHEGHELAAGDLVDVSIEPTDCPVRLGS